MMRGSIVVIMAFLAYFMIGRKQQSFQIAGLVLIVLGLIIIGLASLVSAHETTGTITSNLIGLILIVVA